MSFSEIKETNEITIVNSRIRASFGQAYLTKDIQYRVHVPVEYLQVIQKVFVYHIIS